MLHKCLNPLIFGCVVQTSVSIGLRKLWWFYRVYWCIDWLLIKILILNWNKNRLIFSWLLRPIFKLMFWAYSLIDRLRARFSNHQLENPSEFKLCTAKFIKNILKKLGYRSKGYIMLQIQLVIINWIFRLVKFQFSEIFNEKNGMQILLEMSFILILNSCKLLNAWKVYFGMRYQMVVWQSSNT